ncbi:MAG TPA: amino acid ABC transporter permease [Ktedonobacterales bacterium]
MNTNPIVKFFEYLFTLNGAFRWDLVFKYIFNGYIVQGVVVTIFLALLAQLIGSLIGLLLYFLRRSRLRILRLFGGTYVLLVRGTPLLVQILFLSVFLQIIHVDRFFASMDLFGALGFTIQVPFDAFFAALAALSLNEGAYMAEIVRAGIDSIDTGQMEAAKSLGMTYGVAMRRIVLPQALRVIVPPLGNEFNGMLKNTSLAYAISVSELLYTSYKTFGPALGATLEFLVIASFWYLLLTTGWSIVQSWLERRLNVSNIDPAQLAKVKWWSRLLGTREPATVPGLAPVGPTLEH